MMVFDLMHCSGYRGYYDGLLGSAMSRTKNRKQSAGPSPEEIARKEQERLEQIQWMEQRINELETSIEDYEEISLIGVEVHFSKYGVGTVVEQTDNKITVQFPEIKKGFILDKAYAMRPQFENDEGIVEALTIYICTYSQRD